MRKDRYVVGYREKGNCVYGPIGWIDPLTLSQAKKMSKRVFSPREGKKNKSVIYELVEVTPQPAKER